ncbi:MAG: ATP-binding protein [Sedimentibacter sp.]
MKEFKKDFNYNDNKGLVFVSKIGKNGTPGDILYANDATCNRLGYTINEILSTNPFDIGMPIDGATIKNEITKLLAGETVYYPMLFFTKSNQAILTNIEANLCEFYGNSAVLTVAREIYDHNFIKSIIIKFNKELESKMIQIEESKEHLFQQEKLATIGQIAAGVAHEINNPLGYISSNIETAQVYFSKIKQILDLYHSLFSRVSSIPADELNVEISKITDLRNQSNIDFIMNDIIELFKDTKDGLEKISEIVNNLKTFSRVDPNLEFKEYDLNNGIKETLIIAKNEIKYCADVIEKLGNIPILMASGNRINEVFLNIILNSCYAIKNKEINKRGLITITTNIEDNYVACQIEDNGTGIKKEHLNRIFDPFFTTKPVGSGTGLGLSIAYDIIVNKHHGKIYADSTFGYGTKITIKLPL